MGKLVRLERIGYFDLVPGIGGREVLDTTTLYVAQGYRGGYGMESEFDTFWEIEDAEDARWEFLPSFYSVKVGRIIEESVMP